MKPAINASEGVLKRVVPLVGCGCGRLRYLNVDLSSDIKYLRCF